jgi:hypothetical protein
MSKYANDLRFYVSRGEQLTTSQSAEPNFLKESQNYRIKFLNLPITNLMNLVERHTVELSN